MQRLGQLHPMYCHRPLNNAELGIINPAGDIILNSAVEKEGGNGSSWLACRSYLPEVLRVFTRWVKVVLAGNLPDVNTPTGLSWIGNYYDAASRANSDRKSESPGTTLTSISCRRP
jgi:hypothetical protein